MALAVFAPAMAPPFVRPTFAIMRWEWAAPAFALAAWHDSEQGLVVRFSRPVKQTSPIETDDALCILNWTVVRTDGGDVPDLLCVDPIDIAGYASGTHVRLRFAAPEVRRYESATVTPSAAILTAAGGMPIIPASILYYGVAAPLAPLATAVDVAVGIRDLASDTFGDLAGQLTTDGAGDYRLESAEETIRKLVWRVLMTSAGSYAHLPDYGSAGQVKGLARPSELQRIARTAKTSLLKIPNVLAASVTTRMDPAHGILFITAQVQTRHVGTISVSWQPAGTT